MKIIYCEQRSPEWYSARLGIPTASAFGKLVTATGKVRKGATIDAYAHSLLSERLTRIPARTHETSAMARGRELEPFARIWYSEHSGCSVGQVGFATDDSGRWGCSPDGLCGDHGLEIKCPMLPAFMAYATTHEIPDDHFIQIQACMWIFGLQSWDYVVFTDVRGLVPIVRRVGVDTSIHSVFNDVVPRFCDKLDETEAAMRELGNGVPKDTPIDLSEMEPDVPDLDGIEVPDFEQH